MRLDKEKRAQLTLFVIIAIVAVLGIGGYFLVTNMGEEGDDFSGKSFDEKIDIIRKDVSGCFQVVYEESLIYVGAQGGYAGEPVGYYVKDEGLNLPVYYNRGEVNFPTSGFIEGEIAFAVDSAIGDCFDLAIESYPSIKMEYGDYSTNVSIQENEVEFLTDVRLSFEDDGVVKNVEMNSYPFRARSDLSKMISFADYYISSKIIDNESICISCVTDFAKRMDLAVDFLNYEGDIIIISSYSNDEEALPQYFDFLEILKDYDGPVVPVAGNFVFFNNPDNISIELNVSAPLLE